ncbi:response regulator [Methylobacterium ajmalii]|uniref:Response regulator n=1 Tax=Methylobacterium ajmalii TaxID=2738439 RepID=A0ABV0A1N2_9HYPH
MREITCAILADRGYRVLEAADSEEALRVFGTNAASVDLLLTDVVMPGKVPGREMAESVQSLRPDVRVVFMSGYTDNSIVHHGRLADGVHLIGKPIKREQLARKVAEVLGTAAVLVAGAGKIVPLRPRRDA